MPRKGKKTEGTPSSRARARAKAQRGAAHVRLYTPAPSESTTKDRDVSPLELYRAEKARRARDLTADTRLEQAKREYQALLAADAAKGKGGRPRKKPASPGATRPATEAHGDTFNQGEESERTELDTADEIEAAADETENEEHDEES